MNMHFEAIEMHTKGLSIGPGYEHGLGIAYARADQKDKAIEVANQIEKDSDYWWYAYGLAQVYAVLGEKNKALDYLETAFNSHGDFVPWMIRDPNLKSLKSDQRFIELVNRLNVPD